jgi:multidrug efflux system outer membrane protein
MRLKPCLAILPLLIFTACNLAPQYNRPDLPVVNQWPNVKKNQLQEEAAAQISWRNFFKSPDLQMVISKALENNRDLRIAMLNIEAAQAAYQISKSSLIPQFNAEANITTGQIPSTVSPTGGSVASTYNVGIANTSYELDLFGKIRNMNKMALESYFGTIEARNAAQISLIASTATAYISWLYDVKIYNLLARSYRIQQEIKDITEAGYIHGTNSKMDEVQAESALQTVKAAYEAYANIVAQDRNNLQLLMGTTKEEDLPKVRDFDLLKIMAKLPINLPSETLLNRPDVKEAEHALKAQNANIGIARAAFFPSITLTTGLGFSSNALNNLFKGGSTSGAWNFSPSASLPIFPLTSNFANLELAKVSNKIAIANYEQAIQNAFTDTANALAANKSLTAQVSSQQAMMEAVNQNYQIAKQRQEVGTDSYFSLLSTEQNRIAAEQQLLAAQEQKLIALVNLYAALGGGNFEEEAK